jgi:hypothetical protein
MMGLAGWAKTKKVDNNPAAEAAKVTIREHVLGAVQPAAVFDAFAGSGVMHRNVWHKAAQYCGCDQRHFRDGRLAFVADNRRVLRAIDLRPFNVFDFDAYGSPWEQAIIVADRRPVKPGELVGFTFTDGAGAAFIGNVVPAAVSQLAGLKPGVVGLLRRRDEVMARTIAGLARRMRCRVARQWQASGRTGAAVRYIAVVLEGVPVNAA